MYYGILIYVIGYILAYILLKFLMNEEEITWTDVRVRASWATLSWLTVVVLLLTWIIVFITDYLNDNYPEPPKWL